MGLSAVVRNAVAIANTVTGDLHVAVSHARWNGNDAYGQPAFATAVSRQALVEEVHEFVRGPTGEVVQQKAKVTFIGPITALSPAVTGRRDPIDPRDKITLPDGTTGPILNVVGLMDPSTSAPYLYEVILG